MARSRPATLVAPPRLPNSPNPPRPAELVAGVDEAGRGPWAGPVVAAAVILPTPSTRFDVRIDDSKRLTPRARAEACRVILLHASVGIGIVPADIIDARNIRRATLQAMVDAVHDLPVPPARVLVDGSDRPPLSMPCEAIVGGDGTRYEISCASIVAKVTRDWMMGFYDRLFPGYGFARHKGYGTMEHAAALQSVGPSLLHRLSFEPVANCRRP